jgi:hypothetical protein
MRGNKKEISPPTDGRNKSTQGSQSTSGWLEVAWELGKISSGRTSPLRGRGALPGAGGRLGAGKYLLREDEVHSGVVEHVLEVAWGLGKSTSGRLH